MKGGQKVEQKIIIFADSVKKSEHCIAGIDENGNWIRPISHHGEGELNNQQIRFLNRTTPDILDKVKISINSHASNAAHPEDYFINDTTWELVGRIEKSKIESMVDDEHDLWYQSGERSNRISNENLLLREPVDSICLIKVESYLLKYYTIYDSFNDYNKRKRMIDFYHQDHKFSLSLTDPIFGQRYCRTFPDVGQTERRIEFREPAFFCISLTPELNGYHYKVIATIIE